MAEPGPANGWLVRARPPAAFVRIRACWYASAAMSETNFWAARDRRRFLHGNEWVHKRLEALSIQPDVLAFKPDSLEVIIGDFVGNLVGVLVGRGCGLQYTY